MTGANMKPMRQFLIALLLAWTGACIAAYLYSQQQNIPASLTSAVLPGILLEVGLYLVPGFQEVRKRFEAIPSKWVRAGLLTASGVVPYVVVSLAMGRFSPTSLLLLAVLVAVASFWYVNPKRMWVLDLLFLVFMALVFVSKAFGMLYPHLTTRISLDFLGRLMWIRVGLLAVLSIRRIENVRFGFVPSKREWKIGLQQYVFFLPVGAVLALTLHFARFQPKEGPWWQVVAIAVGTFLGYLWVLAVGEEFFFRGFLQQLLSRGLGSQVAGLLLASSLFGAAHLWFRTFPNWRFAVLAGIAGVFYGLAFMRSGSVRASMVTHALVVSTWRMLFV